jgi:hypothetical protein
MSLTAMAGGSRVASSRAARSVTDADRAKRSKAFQRVAVSMVLTLERQAFIRRHPSVARSMELLI